MEFIITDLQSIPIQNPSVFSSSVDDDEIVLINADTADTLALSNHTAVYIWKLIDGKNSIHDIISGINKKFHSVPETAEKDTLNLIDLLTQDGFIGFELNKA